jgi:curved DNA-binding protein
MKYKDYYAILGVAKEATPDEIKTAYRKLARKYHPDVSKEKDAEEKFKEMSEAYETLKDPEKRAAYDQLGSHRPGEEFRPPPDWGRQYADQFGGGAGGFEDIDLESLFGGLAGRQGRSGARRADFPMPGSDYEAVVRLSFMQAFHGTEVDLELAAIEWTQDGGMRRVPHHVKTRIPPVSPTARSCACPAKGARAPTAGPTAISTSTSRWPSIRSIARPVATSTSTCR